MLTIIKNLLNAAEITHFRKRLSETKWVDGVQTAGGRSRLVKHNLQVPRGDPIGQELGQAILTKCGTNIEFVAAALAEKIFPPTFNCYQDGGHYGTHSDVALMRLPNGRDTIRSDLSATIFLSEPDSYDGGELVIEEMFGAQSIKLKAGDMVLYPSSSLHQVTPVTRGQRICAITWIQSAVASAETRAMLWDLDHAIRGLGAGRPSDDPNISRLVHVYQNLLRRWAHP